MPPSHPPHHRSGAARPRPSPRRRCRLAPLVAIVGIVPVCTVLVVVGVVVVGGTGATAVAQMAPPVDGVVVDTFRPPAHIGAPGNRGWEYATAPGSPVRAVAGGVVVFAGPIGGASYVSIDHGGGLRTAYSHVAAIAVAAGDRVRPGQVIATTGTTFHFGARRDGVYLDPATLFGAGARGRPRLVIRPGRVR